jgi:hypothetical protein
MWISGQETSLQALEEAGLVLAGELMFPDAEHFPSVGAHGAIYAAFAGLVGGDLVAPELRVGLLRRSLGEG